MKIILASASPRRKELLTQIGIEFEIIPSQGEEHITKELPSEIVLELARQKAAFVVDSLQQDEALIIGSDTIVACDDQILGKPRDEEDAYRMLSSLQGREHQVYTGVCMLKKSAGTIEERSFFEKTDVIFYPMTEKEIRDYIDTKDPFDKAGSYGIQGACARYIKGIRGDYNNVVGLPAGRLYQELKSFL